MQKKTQLTLDTKSVDEDNYTVRGVLSTNDKDADGEVIDQSGWVLEDILKNPAVLFAHKQDEPPVGKITQIGFNNNENLEGEIKFAAQEYDFAETIFQLYAGGYMRAFSAGFVNKESERRDGTRVLTENILKEVSTVPIPANANALMKAKEKGIDTAPVEKHLKATVDALSVGDLVQWGSSGGQAYGQVAKIATGEAVSGSLEPEDVSHDTSEDNPGVIVELVERDGGDVIGTGDTVFHRPDALQVISEADVPKGLTRDLHTELAKLINNLSTICKEGRVLSGQNRQAVTQARNALNDVLDRDDTSRSESADNSSTSDGSPEGETPDAGQGGTENEQELVREINRKVRSLLEKKRNIKRSN